MVRISPVLLSRNEMLGRLQIGGPIRILVAGRMPPFKLAHITETTGEHTQRPTDPHVLCAR
jgi:hypothetical protein